MTLAREPKAAAEFVVAVEQEDAQLRADVENLVQDHRDAARLADAGRPQHREVLGQKVVERNPRFDRIVVMQRPDRDAGLARVRIDEAHSSEPTMSAGSPIAG